MRVLCILQNRAPGESLFDVEGKHETGFCFSVVLQFFAVAAVIRGAGKGGGNTVEHAVLYD